MKKSTIYSEGYIRRQNIWKHNSFFGHARMMQTQLGAILDAETTTDETKRKAEIILFAVRELQVSLQTRKDQQS